MILIKEVDKTYFELYDTISMNVDVQSEYRIKRIDNGLGGLLFEKIVVEPYTKDLSVYERATDYRLINRYTNRIYLLTALTFTYFQGFAVCLVSKYVSFSLVVALTNEWIIEH